MEYEEWHIDVPMGMMVCHLGRKGTKSPNCLISDGVLGRNY